MRTIILASKSPRRKLLLEKTGLKFEVIESEFEECFDMELKPHEIAKKLSLEKAREVLKRHKDSIIIAADTIVVCDDKILGKPKDEEDAKKMLKMLSGRMHYVITGFTVYSPAANKFITKSVESKIYFNIVSDKDIDNYVTSKKPFDKAGAYGIQELPELFIKNFEGDYDNIVGLPIQTLLKELRKLGINTS